MSRLLPMAEQLLMMGAIGGQMQPRRQDKTGLAIFGFSAVLGVVSMVYLIIAMSYWLKTQYTPEVAALVTAGTVLSLALLVAACGYAYNVARKSKVEAVTDELKIKVIKAIEAVSEEMEDPIRNYPKSSVALATLAGYLFGTKV